MLTRQSYISRLKDFFGFFNVTAFEASVMERMVTDLPENETKILRKQFETFSRVHRVIDWNGDERLKYGFTDFYYTRFGKAARVPCLLPRLEEVEEKIVYCCRAMDEKMNTIDVTCIAVRGQIFEFQYRSPNHVWYPIGRYRLQRVDQPHTLGLTPD
jgi:hypothetical protein